MHRARCNITETQDMDIRYKAGVQHPTDQLFPTLPYSVPSIPDALQRHPCHDWSDLAPLSCLTRPVSKTPAAHEAPPYIIKLL